MRQFAWKTIGGFLLAALLAAPAWGADVGRPGTINYVEGNARLGTKALDAKSMGTTELGIGQILKTETGKAEVLLTPGVFLRLGSSSAMTMVLPGLTYAEVRLEKGRALVEVTELHRENNLVVTQGHAATTLLKTGLYGFDADHNVVRVFDGKAVVQADDRRLELKGGRQLILDSPGSMGAQKFDKKHYHDDLYNWSNLRSKYLAEASADSARVYVVGGPGWYGTGWYWNPWFDCYTFIPGDGIFYSPFGWGFYSPPWVYRAPVYWGGHYRHRFDRDDHFRNPRPPVTGHQWPSYRPGPEVREPRPREGFEGGFHGGSRFPQGGFHGGGHSPGGIKRR